MRELRVEQLVCPACGEEHLVEVACEGAACLPGTRLRAQRCSVREEQAQECGRCLPGESQA